jgi:hypothetical protein
MLASELAQELGVEAAVLSKRLKLLSEETGTKRVRTLDGQTIQWMRDVHHLVNTTSQITNRTAVQMVLGKYVEPVPAASVSMLDKRLHRLEEHQELLLEKVNLILTFLTNFDNSEGEAAVTSGASGEAPEFRLVPGNIETIMSTINPGGQEAQAASQMHDLPV